MRFVVVAVVVAVAVVVVDSEAGFSLPEAGDRLRKLQEKLSKLNEKPPEAKHHEGLSPQHITKTWTQWMDMSTIAHTDPGKPALKPVLSLASPVDKLHAVRNKLVQRIVQEARLLPSNNQSIISIAFLAFGVILFDVLGDAMFGGTNNVLGALSGGRTPFDSHARETLLPGLGLFGDNLNNLAEVALNMITIYLYREESPDCGERLLCESNQQAVSRGLLDSLVTYISGFLVSFFLHEAPLSRNLQAMRAGRKGQNCIELYPRCSITL